MAGCTERGVEFQHLWSLNAGQVSFPVSMWMPPPLLQCWKAAGLRSIWLHSTWGQADLRVLIWQFGGGQDSSPGLCLGLAQPSPWLQEPVLLRHFRMLEPPSKTGRTQHLISDLTCQMLGVAFGIHSFYGFPGESKMQLSVTKISIAQEHTRDRTVWTWGANLQL